MNGYIQKDTKSELNKAVARIGLMERGFHVAFIENSGVLLGRDDVAYGNVGWIADLFRDKGFKPIYCGFVPEELKPWGIETQEVKLDEVFAKTKIFIKPTPEHQKAFNGFVSLSKAQTQLSLAGYKGEKVLTSPVVNILSEWRCFVVKNELLDARCYKGDFKIAPDWSKAEKIAKTYKAYDAWSFDLAVLDSGLTVIIEMHEVFSLGTYGVNPNTFALMLETAWAQKWKENL